MLVVVFGAAAAVGAGVVGYSLGYSDAKNKYGPSTDKAVEDGKAKGIKGALKVKRP